jgi:hypothetical protein
VQNISSQASRLIDARKYIERNLRSYLDKPVDQDQLVNVVTKLLRDSNIKAEVRIDKDDPDVLSLKKEMNIIDDPDFIHITLSIPQPPLQIIKIDFTL